jgi:thioredoxin reductase (NADPH)
MNEKLYDVIVIGGGPAGLSAAQYAARANLKTVILDKSPTAGALAFTSKIENYPGLVEPVSGRELLDRFRNQAINFGAEYIETQVVGVNVDQDIKEVQTMDNMYKGKSVIIASGSMGRKPAIDGEEEFIGRGVSYCAICDAAFYRDLTVCVVGDSDEAIKEVYVLTEFARTVYLIAPAEKLGTSTSEPPLNNEKVQVLTAQRLVSIEGEDVVTRITLKSSKTGETQSLDMDGVFIYLHGSQPVVDFIDSSLPMNEQSCIMTHRTMDTSIPGVYAAGDVTCGEVRQVVISAAYGSIAALSAEKFLRQRKRMKYDWAKS